LNASHERILEEHLATTRAANEMQASLSKLQLVALKAVEQTDDGLLPEAEKHQEAFERALKAAELAADVPERSLVAAIRRESDAYSERIHLWLDPDEAEVAASARPSSTELVGRVQAITGLLKQLIDFDQQHVERSTEQYAQLSELVNYLRLVFFIGGPAIGILLGVRVAQGLRGSIRKLSSQLKDATKGLNRENAVEETAPSCELPALENQVHEVSDQVGRLVQELDEARQFSARSERLAAVGILAAGVAHELRNPLTSVKLMVQTVALKFRNRPLSDRQLQILQDEIGRMEQSIQSLLDFACMPKPRCVTHDLRDTVERSINLVRPRAGQLRIQITQQFPDSPTPIFCDPAQLHLVFANLLLNGMEAMPAGGSLRVAIHADRVVPTNYCIEIEDTGSGIPSELMDRLFEPFVTGKEHGYGLGLSISRRIVKEHGGIISAVNRPEGGAIFTVELPSGVTELVMQQPHETQEFAHVQAASH
jgi:signal transduction histidine kinase